MKERTINYEDMPMGSVWDGSPIRHTINCNDCPYQVQVQKNTETLKVCAWGVAWKVLQEVAKPRKCLKIDKRLPERSSLNVIYQKDI